MVTFFILYQLRLLVTFTGLRGLVGEGQKGTVKIKLSGTEKISSAPLFILDKITLQSSVTLISNS